MRPYGVDVPVRLMLWTRPDCQKKQFEVVRQAAPSVLFLISDGGRTPQEKAEIQKSRRIFDEIDWDCTVYKLYWEENQGLYQTGEAARKFIWSKVDRCIFLEDDHVPTVSYFRFCAELLEKYKDDERIGAIMGNNVFEVYEDAKPYDYFFSQQGGSIWGTATWKRVAQDFEYPFDYADNTYIKRCLSDNTPKKFFQNVILKYCGNELADHHKPGLEYYYTANHALYHRLNIVATQNQICNIGMNGEHAHIGQEGGEGTASYFGMRTYELQFPLKHPKYVIDDKYFAKKYLESIGISDNPFMVMKFYGKHIWLYAKNGGLFKAVRRVLRRRIHKTVEK